MLWRRSKLLCDGKCCLVLFGLMFCMSVGYMLGALHSLDLTQEAALITDKLNHAELELYEAERQLVQCDQELGHKMSAMLSEGVPQTIFIITPTYVRPTQEVELIMLSHALQHIPFIHWIVVEFTKTSLVSNLLKEFSIPGTHLESYIPPHKQLQDNVNSCSVLRNIALDYLMSNTTLPNGVIMFANTDRSYSEGAFDFVRKIQKIGIWPVAFHPEQFECKPKLKFLSDNKESTIDNPIVYPINIASLGINTVLMKTFSHVRFLTRGSDTFVCSKFLEQLNVSSDVLEIPKTCTKFFVWYTPYHK